MNETTNSILARLKRYGREILYFVTSKIFLKNCLGILAMFLLLTIFTSQWLRCYTRHGKHYTVQDFRGMHIDNAIKIAKAKHFHVVVIDSSFMPGKKPNTVILQEPKPESKVKQNRAIYMTITKRTPDERMPPNLRGGNDEYSQFHRNCGLRDIHVKKIKEEYSYPLAEGTILRVYYKGKDVTNKIAQEKLKIPVGDTLEVVTSTRGGGEIPVPDLTCKTLETAERFINSKKLVVGSVIEDATIYDPSEAYVLKQVPEAGLGLTLPSGGEITLYITQDLPSDCE